MSSCFLTICQSSQCILVFFNLKFKLLSLFNLVDVLVLKEPIFIFHEGRADACNFIKKETLTQVFLYEFCEVFKNTYFI